MQPVKQIVRTLTTPQTDHYESPVWCVVHSALGSPGSFLRDNKLIVSGGTTAVSISLLSLANRLTEGRLLERARRHAAPVMCCISTSLGSALLLDVVWCCQQRSLAASWLGLTFASTTLAVPLLIREQQNDDRVGAMLVVAHGSAAAVCLVNASSALSTQEGTYAAVRLCRATASAIQLVAFRGLELVTGLRVLGPAASLLSKSYQWIIARVQQCLRFFWQRLVSPICRAVFKLVVAITDAALSVGRWVWQVVLSPVGSVLRNWTVTVGTRVATVAQQLLLHTWNYVLAPCGRVIYGIIAAAAEVVQWLWTRVLVPSLHALHTLVTLIMEAIAWVGKQIRLYVLEPIGYMAARLANATAEATVWLSRRMTTLATQLSRQLHNRVLVPARNVVARLLQSLADASTWLVRCCWQHTALPLCRKLLVWVMSPSRKFLSRLCRQASDLFLPAVTLASAAAFGKQGLQRAMQLHVTQAAPFLISSVGFLASANVMLAEYLKRNFTHARSVPTFMERFAVFCYRHIDLHTLDAIVFVRNQLWPHMVTASKATWAGVTAANRTLLRGLTCVSIAAYGAVRTMSASLFSAFRRVLDMGTHVACCIWSNPAASLVASLAGLRWAFLVHHGRIQHPILPKALRLGSPLGVSAGALKFAAGCCQRWVRTSLKSMGTWTQLGLSMASAGWKVFEHSLSLQRPAMHHFQSPSFAWAISIWHLLLSRKLLRDELMVHNPISASAVVRRFGRIGAKAFLLPVVSVSTLTGGEGVLSTAVLRAIQVSSAPAACMWGVLSMRTVAAEVKAWHLHGLTLKSLRVRENDARIMQTTRLLSRLVTAPYAESRTCAICKKSMKLWEQPFARTALLGASDEQSALHRLRWPKDLLGLVFDFMQLTAVLPCQHAYHSSCLRDWCLSQAKIQETPCPCCRARIL